MDYDDISLDEVRRHLRYDAETGLLWWLFKRRGRHPSRPAGCIRKDGYVIIGINGDHFLAHRLAWALHYGKWPLADLDHRDGNPTNNRINNLRDVSRTVNSQNRKGPNRGRKNGLPLGVISEGKRFSARIRVNAENRHIGNFQTPEEAHAAYLKAKRELHPGCTI